jgi:hypothetical protein
VDGILDAAWEALSVDGLDIEGLDIEVTGGVAPRSACVVGGDGGENDAAELDISSRLAALMGAGIDVAETVEAFTTVPPGLIAAQQRLAHRRQVGETLVAVVTADDPGGFGPALQIVTDEATLLMDSVTRFARALREVGLAAGEPPGRQGYPASVFAELPRMFERAGNDDAGTITAFFTVLMAGEDLDDPVADETMGLLDGHIMLSRDLAASGAYPAIDIVRSKSRVMGDITTAQHQSAAAKAVKIVATYRRNYDKISCNAYEQGSDPEVDEAIERIDAVKTFLNQNRQEASTFDRSVAGLMEAAGSGESV